MTQYAALEAKAEIWRQSYGLQDQNSLGQNNFNQQNPQSAAPAEKPPPAGESIETGISEIETKKLTIENDITQIETENYLIETISTQTESASAQAETGEQPDEGAVMKGRDILALLVERAELVRQHLENMQGLAEGAAAFPGGAIRLKAAAFERHALAIRLIVRETEYDGIFLMDKHRWMQDDRLTLSTSASGSYLALLRLPDGTGQNGITLSDYSELADSPLLHAPLTAENAAERAATLTLVIKAARLTARSLQSSNSI